MRDNASLTRPAYIEADLRADVRGGRLCRFRRALAADPREPLRRAGAPDDRLRARTLARGRRARKGWPRATGCAMASKPLCWRSGRVSSPTIPSFAARLSRRPAAPPDYFNQLLRLVYRLIFLAGGRGARACFTRRDAPAAGAQALRRRLFSLGSSARARRSARAAWDRHHDRCEGVQDRLPRPGARREARSACRRSAVCSPRADARSRRGPPVQPRVHGGASIALPGSTDEAVLRPGQLARHGDGGAGLRLRKPARAAPRASATTADVFSFARGRASEGQRSARRPAATTRRTASFRRCSTPRSIPSSTAPRREAGRPAEALLALTRHRPRLRLRPLPARGRAPHRLARRAQPRRAASPPPRLPPRAARRRAPLHPRRRPQPDGGRADEGRALDRDGRARHAARLPRRQHPLRRLAARRLRSRSACGRASPTRPTSR